MPSAGLARSRHREERAGAVVMARVFQAAGRGAAGAILRGLSIEGIAASAEGADASKPCEGKGQPEFAGQMEDGVRAAEVFVGGGQHTHFAKQFRAGEVEAFANPRRLQRLTLESAPREG